VAAVTGTVNEFRNTTNNLCISLCRCRLGQKYLCFPSLSLKNAVPKIFVEHLKKKSFNSSTKLDGMPSGIPELGVVGAIDVTF